MNANPILLQKKYSRVIECFAVEQGTHWMRHWIFFIIPRFIC